MAKALDFPDSAAVLADSYTDLLHNFSAAGVALSISNEMWSQAGVDLDPAYTELLDKKFNTPVKSIDFSGSPEQARAAINKWAEAETKGRVRELMTPDSIGPSTTMVLTDAVCFTGKWNAPFKPAETRAAPFHLDAAHEVSVPTMHAKMDGIKINQQDGLQIIELPYKFDSFTMVLVIPTAVGGLDQIENKLDAPHLQRWTNFYATDPRTVNLAMPKLQLTGRLSGCEILKSIGMPDAVDPQRADFTGMFKTGSHARSFAITQLAQQATATVDEEGTKVAVATEMGNTFSAAPSPTDPVNVTVDRPYIFLIRQNSTGSILLMARVSDPR